MDLTGKVAIVTGAGLGVGRATSRVLARAGCSVVAVDIDLTLAEETVGMIAAGGGTALAARADVAVRADVRRMVETALARFGTLDILANVAGIYPAALVVDITEEQWDRVFAVNMKGVFNCCQAVLPTMMEKRSGKIVNVASTDGMQPGIWPGQSGYGISHYCASKAAVITFTKCLAAEMAPYGVNVNAISPGWIATEKALAGGRFEEGLDARASASWRQTGGGGPGHPVPGLAGGGFHDRGEHGAERRQRDGLAGGWTDGSANHVRR